MDETPTPSLVDEENNKNLEVEPVLTGISSREAALAISEITLHGKVYKKVDFAMRSKQDNLAWLKENFPEVVGAARKLKAPAVVEKCNFQWEILYLRMQYQEKSLAEGSDIEPPPRKKRKLVKILNNNNDNVERKGGVNMLEEWQHQIEEFQRTQSALYEKKLDDAVDRMEGIVKEAVQKPRKKKKKDVCFFLVY